VLATGSGSVGKSARVLSDSYGSNSAGFGRTAVRCQRPAVQCERRLNQRAVTCLFEIGGSTVPAQGSSHRRNGTRSCRQVRMQIGAESCQFGFRRRIGTELISSCSSTMQATGSFSRELGSIWPGISREQSST